MRATIGTVRGVLLAVAACAATQAFGQCQDASTVSAFYGSIFQVPEELRIELKPDLSNPGARALAIGGAFTSSADDATSVVANPAGLGAIVRPTLFAEARPSQVLQYDRFDTGQIDVTQDRDPFIQKDGQSPPPWFASFVLPLGDKFAVAAFYQQLFGSSRSVDRVTGAAAANGPCFETLNPRTGARQNAFVPLYAYEDDTTLSRGGLSAAFRASARFSFGATVYLASESRRTTIKPGWGNGTFENVLPTQVDTSSSKPGYILGVQFTANEWLRFGAVYAGAVKFDAANDAVPGQTVLRRTVIPARAGLGATIAPSPRFAMTLEGTWVQSSTFLDNTDIENGFEGAVAVGAPQSSVRSNWDQSDTWEARIGLEYSVVQTRTRLFSLRAGFWAESPSNLRFTFPQAQDDLVARAANDAIRALFPDVDDPWLTHVTGGLGAVFNKKFQVDVGVDYETHTKRLVGSALLGYTF
ncbi:MAG: hypothetical protein EDX89_08340 [Acidobacteria bacterium]|nr:MAG: hypothetical protein EDX89_08340 [Acidobacteriota bacterium]MCE7959537.1 hypothetical protein [Acidobacteria bacterium ACB2]